MMEKSIKSPQKRSFISYTGLTTPKEPTGAFFTDFQ